MSQCSNSYTVQPLTDTINTTDSSLAREIKSTIHKTSDHHHHHLGHHNSYFLLHIGHIHMQNVMHKQLKLIIVADLVATDSLELLVTLVRMKMTQNKEKNGKSALADLLGWRSMSTRDGVGYFHS